MFVMNPLQACVGVLEVVQAGSNDPNDPTTVTKPPADMYGKGTMLWGFYGLFGIGQLIIKMKLSIIQVTIFVG